MGCAAHVNGDAVHDMRGVCGGKARAAASTAALITTVCAAAASAPVAATATAAHVMIRPVGRPVAKHRATTALKCCAILALDRAK